MKRNTGRLGLCVVASCVSLLCCTVRADGAGAAVQEHRELVFAAELLRRGFDGLAVDQLGRIRRMDSVPGSVRDEATIRLARLYCTLGEQAEAKGDNRGKSDYYEKAAGQYTNYIEKVKDRAGKERVNELIFERSILHHRLGRDCVLGFQLTVDPEEKVKYRQSARKWLGAAESELTSSSAFLVKLRDALQDTARTDEERERFRKVRELTGQALLYLAQTKYYSSKLYVAPEEQEQKAKKLNETIEILRKLADEYAIFDVRYTAERYIGLCYREMGDCKKAIEQFQKALEAHRIPATVWILRRTRLDLAATYRECGMPAKALVTAERLIGELEMSLSGMRTPQEISMLFATRIERAEALVQHAKLLMQQSAEHLKKGDKPQALLERKTAQEDYQQAVNTVSEIAANTRTRWSRNAKALLDQWISESKKILPEPIVIAPNIHTYLAAGWKLYDDGNYAESIGQFQNAVRVANPAVYGRDLLPEAWYKMGQAYYRLSRSGRTGGNYNYYYEAALCFSHIARSYPDADDNLAAQAADMAKEFYAALFDASRKMHRELTYDGERYYRSLESFSERFPSHPDAPRALFQSAELARTLENYVAASRIYDRITADHPRYYEARYRAGLCLYLEALKLSEQSQPPPKIRISQLLQQAAGRFQEYVDWFADNSDLLALEQVDVANEWVAKASLALGKLLVHDVWGFGQDAEGGARRALELLSDFEQTYLSGPTREELRAELLPQAFFVKIQAYRRLDELAEAEKFVKAIIERYSQHRLSSRAASLLGYAYLQKRNELQEGGAEDYQINLAASKAADFLQKALQLDPEQTLNVYLDVAGQLFTIKEYRQGLKILTAGLERFPVRNDRPDKLQLMAMGAVEHAYLQMEDWPALERQAGLLKEIAPRNIDYWMDLGLALEKQERFKEAIGIWRAAKARAGASEEAEFRSTSHLARCYARSGEPDRGFKVLAWLLVGKPKWLQDPSRSAAVLALFEESFSGYFDQLGKYVLQLVKENINLLRAPESSTFVQSLIMQHCPQRVREFRELQRRAAVELRTG